MGREAAGLNFAKQKPQNETAEKDDWYARYPG